MSTKMSLLAAGCVAATLLFSCSGNDKDDNNFPSGLDVDLWRKGVRIGEGELLKATYYSGDQALDVIEEVECTTSKGVELDSNHYVIGVTPGAANVECTYEGETSSVNLAVEDYSPEQLTFNAGHREVHFGIDDEYLDLKVQYSDGRSFDVAPFAEWVSSDESVAIVSEGHIVGLSAGEITLSARHLDFDTKEVRIWVLPDAPEQLEVNQYEPLFNGVPRTFEAIAVYADGEETGLNRQVEWEASNDRVQAISRGVFSGLEEGDVTISATYKGVSGELDTEVLPAILRSVRIVPLAEGDEVPDLPVNKTRDLEVIATLTDNTEIDVSGFATWHQNSTHLAFESSVEENTAFVRGIEPGITFFWADYEGIRSDRTQTIFVCPKDPCD